MTRRAGVPGDQDRTVRSSGGHSWGDPVAANGTLDGRLRGDSHGRRQTGGELANSRSRTDLTPRLSDRDLHSGRGAATAVTALASRRDRGHRGRSLSPCGYGGRAVPSAARTSPGESGSPHTCARVRSSPYDI